MADRSVRELPLLQDNSAALAGVAAPNRGGSAETSTTISGSTASFAGDLEVASRSPRQQRQGPALANEFNYEPPQVRPLPPALRWIRERIFKLFLVTVFCGSILLLIVTYFTMSDRNDKLFFLPCQKEWKNLFKYISIPLVSIIFTWWHVWLGIQMCFYPVNFVGCCKPYLGWQGIVPRRAHVMASRSCDIMIGTLITVEEIIDRVEPDDFFSSLEPVLSSTSRAVVARLAAAKCPEVWDMLPEWCKTEVQNKVMEESRAMFVPVIQDLKANINNIIDIKQMAIEILVNNKPLLVKMFLNIGRREFVLLPFDLLPRLCTMGSSTTGVGKIASTSSG